MAKYKVRRTFPAHIPMKVGHLIEDPKFRNLDQLVSQGYLVEHTGKEPADVKEKPVANITEGQPANVINEPATAKAASTKSKENK